MTLKVALILSGHLARFPIPHSCSSFALPLSAARVLGNPGFSALNSRAENGTFWNSDELPAPRPEILGKKKMFRSSATANVPSDHGLRGGGALIKSE